VVKVMRATLAATATMIGQITSDSAGSMRVPSGQGRQMAIEDRLVVADALGTP
jgi:hypothetical protein